MMIRKLGGVCLLTAVAVMLTVTVFAENSGELSVSRQYDKAKRISRIDYVDQYGAVKTAADKGYATITYDYTPKGKLTCTAYFDENGLPVPGDLGYARMEQKWNSAGTLVSQAYFDETGASMIGPDGFAVETRR